MEYLKQEI